LDVQLAGGVGQSFQLVFEIIMNWQKKDLLKTNNAIIEGRHTEFNVFFW